VRQLGVELGEATHVSGLLGRAEATDEVKRHVDSGSDQEGRP
jgi:hypothetical protein